MRLHILLGLVVLLMLSSTASAATIKVTNRMYPTIQSGIDDAVNGDEVVVATGTYIGPGNVNLDFGGKAITVRSEFEPNDPNLNIIAATIIDCEGSRYNPTRAFWFHTNEDANSRVQGFTIINGYARGAMASAGSGHSFDPIVPDDYNTPPIAGHGDNATGNGYGGAILCVDSSPTIGYCVIIDSTVTGAQGGDGADGLDAIWTYIPDDVYGIMMLGESDPVEVSEGQWGGYGGWGSGFGYGGAIACIGGSNPIIFECVMENNIVRGGCGGNGGAGGEGEKDLEIDDYTANGGNGGEGGDAVGAGMGGAIYCDASSSPIITNCSFRGNIATEALGGLGGSRGPGSDEDPIPVDGKDGDVTTFGFVAGGAVFYDTSSDANFTGCEFTGNEAYDTAYGYMPGGALYSISGNNIYLKDCEFTGNRGGAVFLESNNTLEIESSSFQSNTDAWSGGAVYADVNGIVDINNSSFSGNSAYFDGGAIESKSDIVIKNSSFGSNAAYGYGGGFSGYGGAVDVFSGAVLNAHIENCGFIGNQAVTGGGFAGTFDANFVDCYFIGNNADIGGGLDLVLGDVNIVGGLISGNHATAGDGGGLSLVSSSGQIRDCEITGNIADGAGARGGGINFDADDGPLSVFNCLLTDNTAATFGGGINITSCWTKPDVNNCTFSDNTAGASGGAVSVYQGVPVKIADSIFNNCNNRAIYERTGGDITVEHSLFYNNADGDFYDSGTGLTYTGASEIGSIPGGVSNLYGDPVFVTGLLGLGDFYLNQGLSPAIDSGSALASALGLGSYTTDAAGALEGLSQVDRGYHYSDTSGGALPDYSLMVYVEEGQGTIEILTEPHAAVDPNYFFGTTVTVKATPAIGWLIDGWSGTDNDSSTESLNTVVMTSDKTVGVKFRQPKTLLVSVGGGEPGFYVNIQDAVFDAQDGDTIIVYPGTYRGPEIQLNKSVTIRSLYPDDPTCVAATIIDREGYANRAFSFKSGSEGIIINGLTIQNCTYYIIDGFNATAPRLNGMDGDGTTGGAIEITAGMSPVIKNCIFKDNWIRGAHGGHGGDADESYNAGRGGWGGWSRGGAIYCGPYSKLELINCQIIDNSVIGGNGGDGGDYEPDGGDAGYGGNWSRDDFWKVWRRTILNEEGNKASDGGPYIGDYRWYSGYGGAVYCDVGSTITFTDCTIKGNLAQGGMSGEGGIRLGESPEPEIEYEIPSFGGGVYCGANSVVTFTGCTITDNVSSDPYYDHSTDDDDNRLDNYEPNNTYHLDPYLGHGGGVCAEDSATVIFDDCVVSENQAAAGGGLHWANANPQISDCEFTDNTAYHGGGMFGEHGPAVIIGCKITGNEALSDTNMPDPNNSEVVLGSGAGLHFWATDAEIIDCLISDNLAAYSGGGAYFGGEGQPTVKNCLFDRNRTGNFGGGITSQIYSQLTILNSTVSKNVVTEFAEDVNYGGGGLHCSDGSSVDIIDSIFWGNSGDRGLQIAIDIGPADVNVSYSDIQGGAPSVFVGSNCELIWDEISNLTGTSGSNPLFVNGYYLSEPNTGDANQASQSPCVDAGSDDANALDMYRHTTRTDEVLDSNVVDIGYHYILTSDFVGDFDFDGDVDILDWGILSSHWLEESGFPHWAHGTDLNRDGIVNFEDLSLFEANYGATDETPPTPDRMTWASAPRSAGDTSITMTATEAVDNSGCEVEYEIECVYNGGHSRSWDPCTTYTDTGLAVGTEYGYRVRARDDGNNMTDWSFIGYAITGEDSTPPNPDPTTWAVVPYVSSANSVSMQATTAVDPEGTGVGYYFDCYSHLQFSGIWQGSTIYEVTGLSTNVEYTFRVKARDESQNQNETAWSELASVIISDGNEPEPEPEPEPNEPPQTPNPDPSQWDPVVDSSGFTGHPRQTVDGPGDFDYGFTMRAEEPNQAFADGVEYFFECTSDSSYNSGWQESSTYSRTSVGGEYLNFWFHVKARNMLHPELETAWSPEDSTLY